MILGKAPEALSDTATLESPSPFLAPGTVLAGRYSVVQQVGLGGMGVVYRARDLHLGTDVALKVLRPGVGGPERVERFRRELVLAREVTHKNVVRIHDIGESDGTCFLTMSFIEGRSILDILERDGPLPLERALHILRQVGEALQQAHEVGIVHRDLKPGNILIGQDDTAYLTDFGIARSDLLKGLTESGMVLGTIGYLSPEQVVGGPVDARSDIYALGILLFEMLTGEIPTRGSSMRQELRRRIPDEAESRVPVYLRPILRRCLAPKARHRYSSVREMISEMDARRGRSGRRRLLAVPALGIALAATTGINRPIAVPTFPPGNANPQAIAFLPMRDETGDPSLAWTANGVAEMLAVQVAECPELRVLDSERVRRTLKDLGLEGDRDTRTLRRMADFLEVKYVVTGSVRRAGPSVRVDLSLVQRTENEGHPWSIQAEAAEPSGLFAIVGSLGQQLVEGLGTVQPNEPGESPPKTTSLDAARAYREGREHQAIGDFIGAAPAFDRAVRADPAFVPAVVGASEVAEALGYHDKAVAAAERAAAALTGSETRFAWKARALLARLRGDPDEAEKAYVELVRRYPNETEALMDLATAQASRGAVASAVVTLRGVTELDRSDPRAWFLLGKNMILAGDARQAVSDPLVRALALMTQLGNRQGEGDVINAMGVAHQRLGQYAEAIGRYGEAATIRKEVGDARGVAVSLKNRASVHLATGRFAEAEPDLVTARGVFEKIGDRQDLAAVWNDFGALYEGRGQYLGARQAYQQALGIRRELGDEQQLAQSYDNVGYVLFLQGEPDSARAYWQQALDLRRKLEDKGGIVLSLQNLGFLHTAQGHWKDATKLFLEALEQGRAIDFTNAVAVSKGNIGLLNQYEGRHRAALAAYGEALQLLGKLDDRRGLAEFTIKEATLLNELGSHLAAKEKLDDAAGYLKATRNSEQSSDLQVATGEWHLMNAEGPAALRAFDQAMTLARSSHSPAVLLRARIARAAALVALGRASEAETDLSAAVAQAGEMGDALSRIKAAEALARADLFLHRTEEAHKMAGLAISWGERCGWEEGLFRLYALLGRILESQGDQGEAQRAYRECGARAARVRAELSPELAVSFSNLLAARDTGGVCAAGSQVAEQR